MAKGVPPYDLSCWTRTWKAISKMEALRYIRVDLVTWRTRPKPYHIYEDALFTPLKEVKGLQQFDVFVSWELGKEVEGGRQWPFTIKRTMEHIP